MVRIRPINQLELSKNTMEAVRINEEDPNQIIFNSDNSSIRN